MDGATVRGFRPRPAVQSPPRRRRTRLQQRMAIPECQYLSRPPGRCATPCACRCCGPSFRPISRLAYYECHVDDPMRVGEHLPWARSGFPDNGDSERMGRLWEIAVVPMNCWKWSRSMGQSAVEARSAGDPVSTWAAMGIFLHVRNSDIPYASAPDHATFGGAPGPSRAVLRPPRIRGPRVYQSGAVHRGTNGPHLQASAHEGRNAQRWLACEPSIPGRGSPNPARATSLSARTFPGARQMLIGERVCARSTCTIPEWAHKLGESSTGVGWRLMRRSAAIVLRNRQLLRGMNLSQY